MSDAIARAETSTQPEDLFAEVFGLEKAQLLVPQHPVADVEGTTRYVDFALRTVAERIAFEIDGLTWHVTEPARIRDYEDALLRRLTPDDRVAIHSACEAKGSEYYARLS